MRIALFGGTFDPVHSGHVRLAKEFASRLGFDRVLLVPTFVPPHKLKGRHGRGGGPAGHVPPGGRRAHPQTGGFRSWRSTRGGASFTVDTLADPGRASTPGTEWYAHHRGGHVPHPGHLVAL